MAVQKTTEMDRERREDKRRTKKYAREKNQNEKKNRK